LKDRNKNRKWKRQREQIEERERGREVKRKEAGREGGDWETEGGREGGGKRERHRDKEGIRAIVSEKASKCLCV